MINSGLFFNKDGPMPEFVDPECRKPSRAYLTKLFIEMGVNPNLTAHTVKMIPIHWLAFWGDYRAIKVFLNLNTRDKV